MDGLPAFALFGLGFAYYIAMERLAGGTIGKRLLGLRVVRVDGRPLGWGGAIVRNLMRPIDGLPLLYLLGIVTIAISGKDQRLGDMLAGTVVVGEGPG